MTATPHEHAAADDPELVDAAGIEAEIAEAAEVAMAAIAKRYEQASASLAALIENDGSTDSQQQTELSA